MEEGFDTGKFDVVKFLQRLIQFKSVTPHDDGAIPFLAQTLESIGFETHIHNIGQGANSTMNLYATYGKVDGLSKASAPKASAPQKNFCFAGHTDVVPAGENAENIQNTWKFDPFSAQIEDGILYGRGAVDMKGAIACFVGAAHRLITQNPDVGIISLLITGDEEGGGENGTVKLLKIIKDPIDYCIVGEPTSDQNVVDNIKIGRRGSVNFTLKVVGTQGHVAYPEKAINPIYPMVDILQALKSHGFNDASEHFQSTALEVTSIDVGNSASNVIPNQVVAKFNVRTSNLMESAKLIPLIHKIIVESSKDFNIEYELQPRISGESFLNNPTILLQNALNAVENVVGEVPDVTTLGGTSDARFIKDYCSEMLEIGLLNTSAHQVDENVAINDLEILTDVYFSILCDTLLG